MGYYQKKETRYVPFEEVAVDITGPWVVQIRRRSHKFYTLTVIDTFTNLVEIVRLDNKTFEHVTRKFNQVWMSRYPWPDKCVHENEGDFTG